MLINSLLSGAISAPIPKLAYELSSGELFILLFIMLGPLKMLAPFHTATKDLEPGALRALALRLFILGLVTAVIGGWIGSFMLVKWRLTIGVLQIAAGLIFLLVALQAVMQQYNPPSKIIGPSTSQLLFPVTVTPYGIAAVILMLAASSNIQHSLLVIGLVSLVMLLNLLSMIFARGLVQWIGPIPLQILGAVLMVLQVALALRILLGGIARVGINVIAA